MSHGYPQPRPVDPPLPAVRGLSSGRPDYEANASVTLARKQGVNGLPGEYYAMIAGWPHLRSRYQNHRAVAASIPVERPALENETPYEARFNDAVDRLLFDGGIVVETGDGVRVGLGHWLKHADDALFYGFALAWPRWEDGGRGLFGGSRVILTPLLQSAVYTMGPGTYVDSDGGQHRTNVVAYQAPGSPQWIRPLSSCLHIANDALPGEHFGRGVLRALVAPWQFYQAARVGQSEDNAMRRGVLKIYKGAGESTGQDDAAEALGNSWGEGRGWIAIPDGKGGEMDAEIVFPSGSPADYESAIRSYNGEVDTLFGTEALAIHNAAHGSRAAAEVMDAAGREAGLRNAAELVDVAVGKVVRWVAAQELYNGRIRDAVIGSEAEQDLAERATTIAALKTAGVIRWTDVDEEREREVFGLATLDEARASVPVEQVAPMQAPTRAAESSRTLAVISGPPAAGKSTLAATLARDHDGPATLISADGFLYDDAGAFAWTSEQSAKAHAAMRAKLATAMERGDSLIVFESPLMSSARRAELAARAREAGYTPVAYAVTASLETLAQRNGSRPPERQIPEAQLRAMAAAYHPPTEDEGFARVVTAPAVRLAHDCGPGCSHDHGVRLATDAPTAHRIMGADGVEVEMYRPALAIDIRGTVVYPEAFVTLATDVRKRDQRAQQLRGELATYLDEYRESLFDDLAEAQAAGRSIGDATETARTRARRELLVLLQGHFDRLREDMGESRMAEAAAQRRSPLTGPGITLEDFIGVEVAAKARRVAASIEAAADAIISKVSTEVVRWFVGNGSRVGFTPGRELNNYIREIEPAESAAEAGIAGIDRVTIEPGRVVTAAVRLSTKQYVGRRSVCKVCKADDGKVFRFPEDRAAFAAYRDLPDPLCTSAARGGISLCQCSWALVYATEDT